MQSVDKLLNQRRRIVLRGIDHRLSWVVPSSGLDRGKRRIEYGDEPLLFSGRHPAGHELHHAGTLLVAARNPEGRVVGHPGRDGLRDELANPVPVLPGDVPEVVIESIEDVR